MVEALTELGRVTRQMLGVGLVIGAVQGALTLPRIVLSLRKSSISTLAAPPPVTTG